MPKKPNYNFEKRQKELARKQKQEEKRTRRREEAELPAATPPSTSGTPQTPATE
jgi:hypothetical protein